MPLKDAPLTASVNCAESDASVVLMLAMSAPGLARLGDRGLDRIDRRDDRVDRGGRRIENGLALRKSGVRGGHDAAVRTQLLADRPIGRVLGGVRDRQAGRNLVLGDRKVLSVMFRDCSADSAEAFVNIELTLMGMLSSV